MVLFRSIFPSSANQSKLVTITNGCKLQLRDNKLHKRQIPANADSQVLRQIVSQTGQPFAELAHKLHQSINH